MSKYVGVDWAGNGWLTATVDDGEWSVRRHPSIFSVWYHNSQADQILVDIPIGLPERGRRAVDEAAKQYLGAGRQSTVFYTPTRDAVHSDSYQDARKANGGGLGSNSWGFTTRIQEVDDFLVGSKEFGGGPLHKDRIIESHPEVCFHALNEEASLDSKHDESGRDERLKILERHSEAAEECYHSAVQTHICETDEWARRIGKNNRDDLLDAICLALSAALAEGDLEWLPRDVDGYDWEVSRDVPPTDSKGLPMQIVYHDPSNKP